MKTSEALSRINALESIDGAILPGHVINDYAYHRFFSFINHDNNIPTIRKKQPCYRYFRNCTSNKLDLTLFFSTNLVSNEFKPKNDKHTADVNQYIHELCSKEGLYWDSLLKHNKPIGKYNTPDYIKDFGLIVYNPSKTKMPTLMSFLSFIRFISEYPGVITAYAKLRNEFKYSIRAAFLTCCFLGHRIPSILYLGSALNFLPEEHTPYSNNYMDKDSFKYVMFNGVDSEYPPITEKLFYGVEGYSRWLKPFKAKGGLMGGELTNCFKKELPIEILMRHGELVGRGAGRRTSFSAYVNNSGISKVKDTFKKEQEKLRAETTSQFNMESSWFDFARDLIEFYYEKNDIEWREK